MKDVVSNLQSSLPDDMKEPKVSVIEIKRDLIELSITSSTLNVLEIKRNSQTRKR